MVAGTSWPGANARGPATGVPLYIAALAAAADGGFLVGGPRQVWRVGADGRIAVVAGDGKWGFSGDGGPATAARLDRVDGLAAMADGGFLIADEHNDSVRRVWPDGHISTVAGSGPYTISSGDGGPATAAGLDGPSSVAALLDGGFLIAEFGANRVRRVWPDGHISTVAGSGGYGFSGDRGPATAAQLGGRGAARWELRDQRGTGITIPGRPSSRVTRQYGLTVRPARGVERAGSPTVFVG